MKKILIFLFCGVMILGMATGCGKTAELNKVDKDVNNIIDNSNDNQDDKTTNNSNKNKSEFELAIENYKNAKSMSIELNSQSKEIDGDYARESKAEIFIDYENGLIDFHNTYSYYSLIPSSNNTRDTHEYYDIKNDKAYMYDSECKTWYYYKMSYKDDNRYLKYLDKILSLKESDAKKVSNNYHFGNQDLMIDNNKITWFRMDDTGSQKVSENLEYTFKSFNDTTVTLPSEVKKAVPEKDLCD